MTVVVVDVANILLPFNDMAVAVGFERVVVVAVRRSPFGLCTLLITFGPPVLGGGVATATAEDERDEDGDDDDDEEADEDVDDIDTDDEGIMDDCDDD